MQQFNLKSIGIIKPNIIGRHVFVLYNMYGEKKNNLSARFLKPLTTMNGYTSTAFETESSRKKTL